jgi:DNA-binding response OmpR family regulator
MPRLLLVEDAADVALIVERLGRRMGLEVVHRMDVASAWDCLRQARPDLILLDLNLVGERGEELCRRVRALPETAGIPIALFVHGQCSDDLISGLTAGADYVVAKDFLCRPAEFHARLGDILAGCDGLSPASSIICQRTALLPQPSREGLQTLNLVLRHPLMRQLGSDVVRFLLRQAARRAGGGEEWFEADGLALDVQHVATVAASEAVAVFAAAVADQLQRFLGTQTSAPVRDALTAVVNRLSA